MKLFLNLFESILMFRLKEDLQGNVLIGEMEECRSSLYNLVLTGTATPFFHNGTLVYDSDGKALVT